MTNKAERVDGSAEDAPITEIGSVIAGQIVLVTPVRYAGNEQSYLMGRPPVNEFMLNNPA